ncbi:MAG: hypothetical protein JSW51_05660 [Gemmatimonadota bacterium]|nr:MAG: hypothetical protein JSW51_05660 [Gemmatimonadota bacterium]
MGKRILCSACVTFVLALLAIVPGVFVWNLFRNGQGSVDWGVSLGVAALAAGLISVAQATKTTAGHTRHH